MEVEFVFSHAKSWATRESTVSYSTVSPVRVEKFDGKLPESEHDEHTLHPQPSERRFAGETVQPVDCTQAAQLLTVPTAERDKTVGLMGITVTCCLGLPDCQGNSLRDTGAWHSKGRFLDYAH